jgi:predicted transcriptional regulator of viral defense system
MTLPILGIFVYTRTMKEDLTGAKQNPRTLSRREASLVGWLEAERRRTITSADVQTIFDWSPQITAHTLSRLRKKGWITRVSRGAYETVLAETGGWALPNPWAALSLWKQRYYVGFQSAAYERGLTPDAPGDVQACVPIGARKPLAWAEIPVALIFQKDCGLDGTDEQDVHGFRIRLATTAKILVDGGALPGRLGGIPGLARVVARAVDAVDWLGVAKIAANHKQGHVSLRRVATLLELLGFDVPAAIGKQATAKPGESVLFLGERRIFGATGERREQWQVVINIDPSRLREEIAR